MNRPHRRPRFTRTWGVGLIVLATNGCFVASEPFTPPAPEARPSLEERVRVDPTDVDAVVALALLDLAESRVEAAAALLERTDTLIPGDPAVSLLVALAHEESGSFLEARDRYAAYSRSFGGSLAAHARMRMQAVQLEALREGARRLLAAPAPPMTETDRRTVLVIPPAHDGSVEEEGGAAAAVADLLSLGLRGRGWTLVDPRPVRILLEVMGADPATWANLSLAVRLGPLLGARHVVQIQSRRPAVDSLHWDMTVMSIDAEGTLAVGQASLRTGEAGAPAMLSRAPRVVRAILEGSGFPVDDDPSPTRNPDALLAFGRALRAMDAGDLGEAEARIAEALEADPDFRPALRLAETTATLRLAQAVPLVTAAEEVARIGQLQRSVAGLRGDPAAGHAAALEAVGGRERAVVSDVLGLDRVGGSTLLEVTFSAPGGGTP